MLYELLETGAIAVSWPIKVDGKKVVASKLSEHNFCATRCSTRECEHFSEHHSGARCGQGLSYFQRNIEGAQVVIYGVCDPRLAPDRESSQYKLYSKGRSISTHDIDAWQERISKVTLLTQQAVNQQLKDRFRALHDSVKLSQSVATISEDIINKHGKTSFADNYQAAAPQLKTLFQAARMLRDSFFTYQIYLNPASANFGKKRTFSIYKLFDVIRYVLWQQMEEKHIEIKFSGESHRQYEVQESFRIIPFCLLQNAVKYTQSGNIEVQFIETEGGLDVFVESIGPLIEPTEIPKLFDAGYRGKFASALHHDGTGIGLYVAQIVANAHRTEINVSSRSLDYSYSGIPQAENKFSFHVFKK